MAKRVCITGTESTGKTVLAEQLAKQFDCPLLEDVSRKYITDLTAPYTQEDVLTIARKIIEAETIMRSETNSFFISDNDLINIKIWLMYYDWSVPDWLEEAILRTSEDIFLLCDIDLQWQADEQRQNPNDRAELFSQFKQALEQLEVNYSVVNGQGGERLERAIQIIGELN
jgi:nicotinamide riboside kinase